MNKEIIIEEILDNINRPIKYKTNKYTYDIETAMDLIEKGKIKNAVVITDKYGLRHIRINNK